MDEGDAEGGLGEVMILHLYQVLRMCRNEKSPFSPFPT